MHAERGRTALLAVLAVAAGGGVACTTGRRAPRVSPTTTIGLPDLVQDLARRAVTLDAAGDPAADSLYAPEALVVANARIRMGAPRFAGVGYGGRATVAAASVTLEGRFAWVLVDYRWINPERNQAEAGRATFVCEQKPNGWKIVHVHSSQVMPWDR